MRPSRTRKAPVAADGTALVAPKIRRRSTARRSETLSDAGTSDRTREHSSARSSPAEPRVRAAAAASPLKKATTIERRINEAERDEDSDTELSDVPSTASSVKRNADKRHSIDIDDDSDLELADVPANAVLDRHSLAAAKPVDATPTRRPPQKLVASPLDDLPLPIRQEFIPRARRSIAAVLSGQLPPAGRDADGHFDGSECIGLEEQWRSLYSTIHGTLEGEGNSALLVGAPGTGKDMLLRSVLRSLEGSDHKKRFHLVHLDAARQETDRQSLRELALQLVRAGAIRLPKPGEEGALDLNLDPDEKGKEDDDVDVEMEDAAKVNDNEEETIALQNAVLSSLANTTSTILTLLSSGQTESQTKLPLIIQLSSFDQYTSRPRQALLYVLLDAVQAGSYTPGLCVVGTTSRVDTTDLLEKRVRSRFSGRTINVWPSVPWAEVLQRTLSLGLSGESSDNGSAFDRAWKKELENISKDKNLLDAIALWESMSNDVCSLYRILFPVVASLSADMPSIHSALLGHANRKDNSKNGILDDLTMPEFALLIAAKQLLGKDREVFNFAMCYDELCRFVARVERDRAGASTSITDIRRYATESVYDDESVASSPRKRSAMQVNVAWSGLQDRRRVMTAFRTLLSLELFQPEVVLNALALPTIATTRTTAGPSAARRAAQTAKTDFIRVKCTLFPQTIVEAAKSRTRVEPLNVHLVQWAASQS